jgi:hypothetical protein
LAIGKLKRPQDIFRRQKLPVYALTSPGGSKLIEAAETRESKQLFHLKNQETVMKRPHSLIVFISLRLQPQLSDYSLHGFYLPSFPNVSL